MANSPLNGGSLLNGGQQGGTLSVANGGTGAITPAGAKVNLGLPPSTQAVGPYLSGRSYLIGAPGMGTLTTNTALLVTDTMYGVIGWINQPVTITALSFCTSSSNAGVGDSVKFGLYALDANMLPSTRLGLTTTGIAIADLALSTAVTGTLDAPVTLAAGAYIFTLLPTAVTTGVRATIYTNTNLYSFTNGASTPSNALKSGGIVGYTSSVSYASGIPVSYGTTTTITSITNYPALAFTVQ